MKKALQTLFVKTSYMLNFKNGINKICQDVSQFFKLYKVMDDRFGPHNRKTGWRNVKMRYDDEEDDNVGDI